MKMKTFAKILGAAFFAGLSFTGCSFLSDGLSSNMQAALEEETGKASLASKVWYYNGLSSDKMSERAEKLGPSYYDQTLLVSFSKKVAGSPTGSMEIKYTDSSSCVATKTFSSISGTFTDDYKAFKIDMSPVMELFDTETIPSGVASMTLKIGGLVCAEGRQSGRAISSLEVKNIQIKPLYSSMIADCSTKGFSSSSSIYYSVNGEVSLDGGSYTVSGQGSDGASYSFVVSTKDSSIVLQPSSIFDFDALSNIDDEGIQVPLSLKNILPVNAGSAYSKKITVNFTKYSIVIDGKMDDNFSASNGATVYTDPSGDVSAFSAVDSSWADSVSQTTDIQSVAVTSDNYYLYVAVSGNLVSTWNDGIMLLLSNGSLTGASGASLPYTGANAESFAYKTGSRTIVQPNIYIAHQPGYENSGYGLLQATSYDSTAKTCTDISSYVLCSPAGWTDAASQSYVEYAIPLGKTGLASGDTVSLIVASTLHWNATVDGETQQVWAVADAASDESVTFNNEDGTNVTYSFEKAIHYTIE